MTPSSISTKATALSSFQPPLSEKPLERSPLLRTLESMKKNLNELHLTLNEIQNDPHHEITFSIDTSSSQTKRTINLINRFCISILKESFQRTLNILPIELIAEYELELIYPVSHWLRLVRDSLEKEVQEIEKNQTQEVFLKNSLFNQKITKVSKEKEPEASREILPNALDALGIPAQKAREELPSDNSINPETEEASLKTTLSSIILSQESVDKAVGILRDNLRLRREQPELQRAPLRLPQVLARHEENIDVENTNYDSLWQQINNETETFWNEVVRLTFLIIADRLPLRTSCHKEDIRLLNEGYDQRSFTKIFLGFLHTQSSSDNEEAKILTALKNRLIAGVEKKIASRRAIPASTFHRFFAPFLLHVYHLKSCEGIAFLGGYKAQEGALGHAVLYEVERQPDGLFQLRTIDTGDYVKQNWHDWSKGKISSVHKNLLWEELCQQETLTILENLDNTYHCMKDSQTALSAILNSRARWEDFNVLLQKKGTCVVSSHFGWLELHLRAGSEGRVFLQLMHTIRVRLLQTFVRHLETVITRTPFIEKKIRQLENDDTRAKHERLLQCAPRLLVDAKRVLASIQSPSANSCVIL